MINKIATGVPRSGTHFLAQIFGWTHEKFYKPGYRRGYPQHPEVSWAAAAFVDPKQVFVLQIVRDPLKVLASNIHRDWLKEQNAWGKLAYNHTKTYNIFEFYLKWFKLAESKAHSTVRLEDIQHLGPRTNQFGVPKPIKIPEQYYDSVREIGKEYGYRI